MAQEMRNSSWETQSSMLRPAGERKGKRIRTNACQRCSTKKIRCSRQNESKPCINCLDSCTECRPRVPKRIGIHRRPRKLPFEVKVLKPAKEKRRHVEKCVEEATPKKYQEYSDRYPLPDFIRPLSNDMDEYAWNYLSSEGAFTLPDDNFEHALLRAYIQHVHPLLPILELEAFVKAVLSSSSQKENQDLLPMENKISLLLYWAVAYSATPNVPLRALRKAGFNSYYEAQRSYYIRIKALYNVKAEEDKLSVIQALLFIVYGKDITMDTKDMAYWKTIIWLYMQDLGIDMEIRREYQPTANHSTRTSLYRRIWWSSFVCDRLCTLAACTDPILPRLEGIRPLGLEDMEKFQYPDYAIHGLGSGISFNYALFTHYSHLCIIQAHVCLVLDHIISGPHGRSPIHLQQISSDQALAEIRRLLYYHEDLLKCHKRVTLHRSQRHALLHGQIQSHDPVNIHESILCIIIDAVLAFLLQRQIILQEVLRDRDDSSDPQTMADGIETYPIDCSLRRSRFVIIHSICVRFSYLKHQGQLSKLHPMIVSLLLPAAIHYLTQIRSSRGTGNGAVDASYGLYLKECLSVFQVLGKENPSVGQWAEYLENEASSTDISSVSTYNSGPACAVDQEAHLKNIICKTEPQTLSSLDIYEEPVQMCMKWWYGDGAAIS